jgi:hypothetical protein
LESGCTGQRKAHRRPSRLHTPARMSKKLKNTQAKKELTREGLAGVRRAIGYPGYPQGKEN